MVLPALAAHMRVGGAKRAFARVAPSTRRVIAFAVRALVKGGRGRGRAARFWRTALLAVASFFIVVLFTRRLDGAPALGNVVTGSGGGGAAMLEGWGEGVDVGGGKEDAVARAIGDAELGDAVVGAREKFARRPMSIVVLFHSEYETLEPVLESWIRGGLIDYAEEVLFFLNGVGDEAEFHRRLPGLGRTSEGRPAGSVRVVPQSPNLPLGLAIKRMVELASNDVVLLLEKDWELVEPREVMISRLHDSKVLIGSGRVNVVRHRHRHNPGVPIHAMIMHAGREESIMRQQPNLLCFAHHWQSDPSAEFPGLGIIRRCGGQLGMLEEEDVFCTPAAYCQWTNNPAIFSKSWFLGAVLNRYEEEYNKELAAEGKDSPFLDFEYYTNWRGFAWNELNISVATGAGLFSHHEVEHSHFNKFWYAFYRLRTDMEEIRSTYLKNESRFKALGGVHFDPAGNPPATVVERYPVDFVRKYQVPSAFLGNLSSQIDLIDKIYLPYVHDYRVQYNAALHGSGDNGEGSADIGKGLVSVQAQKTVPWRQLITDLHFATEKALMLVPPVMPHETSITLITSLLDLDRHNVDRDFSMYIDAIIKWLAHEYKKVVYTSPDLEAKLLPLMTDGMKASTKFIHTTRADLRTKWIGPDNYDKVQEIRKRESWRAIASWLAKSPQALLQDYNPLVMAKMFMIRDAARSNPWDTSHFLFIDAKHNCQNARQITPRSDHIFRAHMLNKLLLTYFEYTPASEVHGFEYEKFNTWLNQASSERKMVKVGRGGVIGGSAFVIESLTAMYDIALTATLREGLMGTEENILSILMAQVPQYIDIFSNNWACHRNVENDHKCTVPDDPSGYNCGIFMWAAKGAPQLGPDGGIKRVDMNV